MSNATSTSASSSSSSSSSSGPILPPPLVPPPATVTPALEAVVAETAQAAVTAHNDVWPFRLTIVALGSATLLPVAGAIALGIEGKTVPEILISIASVAAGALAGFIMPSPAKAQAASDSSAATKGATR